MLTPLSLTQHLPLRTLALLVVLAAILGSGELAAQGLFEQILSPRARQLRIEPNIYAERAFRRNARSQAGSLSQWRAGASATVPAAIFRDSGVTFGPPGQRPRHITPPEVEGEAPPPDLTTGFILANVFYEHREIDDGVGFLPPRYQTAGFGTAGLFNLSRADRPVQLGVALNYALRTDGEDPSFSDGQTTAVALLSIPLGDSWTLIPGVSYISDLQVDSLEGIPLPFLQAVYAPSREFRIIMGLPINSIMWMPTNWLELRAISFGGLSGEISASQHLSESLTIREFVGNYGELFNLTDPAFPSDSRLIITGLRAGTEVTWNPWDSITLSFRHEFQFETRARVEDKNVRQSDVRYEPGHALWVSASIRF